MSTDSLRLEPINVDRIGIAASVLCAIHCGLAPVFLIALPSFGKIWAHPASHALAAIFIVPLAILSIYSGYKKHRKRWVMVTALSGIFCILLGTVLPLFELKTATLTTSPVDTPINITSEPETECSAGCATTSEANPDTGSNSDTESLTCNDNCCPSVQIGETGDISLHIPPAAIVTTLGGLLLITAHLGNIFGHRQYHCCDKHTLCSEV